MAAPAQKRKRSASLDILTEDSHPFKKANLKGANNVISKSGNAPCKFPYMLLI